MLATETFKSCMNKLTKLVRRVIGKVLGKRTWQEIEHFDPSWSLRIKEMAKHIREGESVLDLGCGKMWLRQFLPNNVYYPVDYTDRGSGSIVCDFNQKQFPQNSADVAFVSGTLEYIIDAQWFVSCIGQKCSRCIISYCLLEDYPDLDFRRERAWVNDFSRDDIIRMFSAEGFQLASEGYAIPKNRIFYFVKSV